MALLFVVTLWALVAAVYLAINAWDAYQQARWEAAEMERLRRMREALR